MSQPTQPLSGSTTDTTGDTIPPGAESHVKLSAAPTAQVSRLKEFLAANFPEEVERSNAQHPETAADTAIRLLTGMHAHTPPTEVRRCGDQYCNKPQHHKDVHGWVHYG